MQLVARRKGKVKDLARRALGATGADENEFRRREIIALGRKIS